MNKKAIRVTIDAPSKNAFNKTEGEIMNVLSDLPKKFGQNGASVRISPYEPEDPAQLSSELGSMVRWMAGKENRPGNPVEEVEQLTEEDLTFRQQVREFWRLLKPEAIKLGKEIWYSKKRLKEMEAEARGENLVEKPRDRISVGSVKFGQPKTET